MEERTIETLRLDGGHLTLDFINTVHDRTEEHPHEYLPDYHQLLEWSVKAGALTSTEKDMLASVAREKSDQADQVLHRIIGVRENLYDIFVAVTEKKRVKNEVQAVFNSTLSEVMSQLELRIEDNLEVQQHWKNSKDLIYPLYPVIKSAYDLLTSDMLDRVKECGSCGWLFLDQSKNKSRKWCSMETCGSNVKAKRYYHRNKK